MRRENHKRLYGSRERTSSWFVSVARAKRGLGGEEPTLPNRLHPLEHAAEGARRTEYRTRKEQADGAGIVSCRHKKAGPRRRFDAVWLRDTGEDAPRGSRSQVQPAAERIWLSRGRNLLARTICGQRKIAMLRDQILGRSPGSAAEGARVASAGWRSRQLLAARLLLEHGGAEGFKTMGDTPAPSLAPVLDCQ